MAAWMHKAALVRSVNHKAGCHNTLPSYTGYEVAAARPSPTRDTYPPSMGSVCEYLDSNGRQDGDCPPTSTCRATSAGARRPRGPALTAASWASATTRSAPSATPYVDEGCRPTAAAQPAAGARRAAPVQQPTWRRASPLDRLELAASLLAADSTISCALVRERQLLGSYDRSAAAGLRPADVARTCGRRSTWTTKTRRLRDRYGRTLFGTSTLIARQLVEAGVRFVNVIWDNYRQPAARSDFDAWDTHEQQLHHPARSQPARLRPDLFAPCWKTWTTAACSTRRWSS